MAGQTVEEVALHPLRAGDLADADCVGKHGTPGHGPYLVVFLELDGGRIVESSCQTYGCPAAIACGSKLAEYVVGKTVREARYLTPERLRAMFRKYPPGKRHCAKIAVAALRDALDGWAEPAGCRSTISDKEGG